MFPTLMLLSLTILRPIRVMAKAKVPRVNFTPMTLAAPLTLRSAWHYQNLCHMAIDKASLSMVEGNQLPDATFVASMDIFFK